MTQIASDWSDKATRHMCVTWNAIARRDSLSSHIIICLYCICIRNYALHRDVARGSEAGGAGGLVQVAELHAIHPGSQRQLVLKRVPGPQRERPPAPDVAVQDEP